MSSRRPARALLCAALSLLLLPTVASAAWTPPSDRSARGYTGQTRVEPKVVVDAAGRVTAVWAVWSGDTAYLQASRRSAGGTWAPTQTLMQSARGITADEVELGVDAQGTVTVVYVRSADIPTTGVYARTAVADQEFGPEETIRAAVDDQMPCAGMPGAPSLTVSPAGAATVAFRRFCYSSDDRILLARRAAGSGVWGALEHVHEDDQVANLRVADLPADGVLVVWEQCPSNGPGVCVLKSRARGGDGAYAATQSLGDPEDGPHASGAFDLAVDAGGNATLARAPYNDFSGIGLTVTRRPAGGAWSQPAKLSGTVASVDAILDPAGAVTIVSLLDDKVWWHRPAADAWTTGRLDPGVDVDLNGQCAGGGGLPFSGAYDGPVKGASDSAGNLVVTFERHLVACGWSSSEIVAATKPAGAPWGFPQSVSTPVVRTSESNAGVLDPWVATDGAGDAVVVWEQTESAQLGTATAAFVASSQTEPGTLANQTPTLEIEAPEDPVAGPVALTATADDADGTAGEVAWDTDLDGQFDDTATPTLGAGQRTVRARTSDDEGDVVVARTTFTVREAKGPQVTFTIAPAEPRAGRDITFTAGVTPGDNEVTGYGWDLDGDHDYDDATTKTVVTRLPAGEHLVGVQVTDAAGLTAFDAATVTVGEAVAEEEPPADEETPATEKPVTQEPKPAAEQAPAATPTPAPGPAVSYSDSTVTAPMPKVTGLRLDAARDALVKAGIQSDITVRFKHAAAPLGDVTQSTPKAGAPTVSGVGSFLPVTLVVSIGDRKGACPLAEAKKVLKGADLDVVLDLLRKSTCKVDDVNYTLSKRAGDPEIGKVTRDGGKVDVGVTLSDDPKDHDLFLTFRENPSYASFSGEDWTLPKLGNQRSSFNVQVLDRAGRLVQGARIAFDTSDVGTKDDIDPKKTDRDGEAPVSFVPERGGVVDVVVSADTANEQTLYGVAKLKVVALDRSLKEGEVFTTITGRRLKRSGDSLVFQGYTAPRGVTARASASRFDFGTLANWLGQLVGGVSAAAQQALQAAAEPVVRLGNVARSFAIYPTQIAASSRPIGDQVQKIDPVTGQVTLIGAAGGNVVSAGGMNLIGTAAGNVVAAGGMNLIAAAKSGVVAAGGMNLIGTAAGNVVSAGSANAIVLKDGSKLLSDNGLGVVAAGGGNLFAFKSAGLK